jgi:hypothetical protein
MSFYAVAKRKDSQRFVTKVIIEARLAVVGFRRWIAGGFTREVPP